MNFKKRIDLYDVVQGNMPNPPAYNLKANFNLNNLHQKSTFSIILY